MLSYCLKCRKTTESKNSKVLKTKNKNNALSHFVVCSNKISRFIKEQKASRISSSLGLRTPLSKIILLGPILGGIK